jgi:hypothetical protein
VTAHHHEVGVFDWLFDGAWTVYLVFGSAGAVLTVAWCKTRNKYCAIAVGVVVALFVIYIVLQFFVETASEQMERRVRDIAGSVKSKQIKNVLEKNLSDDFHAGSYNKRDFLEKAQSLADQHHVDSVEVWDIKLVEIDREIRTAKLSFKAKPKIEGQETPWYLVVAVFVMTPKESWWQKEEWKMQSFQYFNAVADSEKPLDIP